MRHMTGLTLPLRDRATSRIVPVSGSLHTEGRLNGKRATPALFDAAVIHNGRVGLQSLAQIVAGALTFYWREKPPKPPKPPNVLTLWGDRRI
jgi:hypothetical protein